MPPASEPRQIAWAAALLLLALAAPPLLLFRVSSTFPGQNHLLELAICTAFAVAGYLSRGVSASGAIAGLAISYAIYVGANLAGFVLLVALFALTWTCTRIGAERKRGISARDDSRGRNAAQVTANLGIAGMAALFALASEEPRLYLLVLVAALAETAADTVSSEIGEATGHDALLITTLRRVPAGTDGGITVLGTCCGILAALFLVGLARGLHVFGDGAALIAAATATFGMIFDSFLGATLERRRILGNNGVNFLGTTFAAALAWLAGHRLLHW